MTRAEARCLKALGYRHASLRNFRLAPDRPQEQPGTHPGCLVSGPVPRAARPHAEVSATQKVSNRSRFRSFGNSAVPSRADMIFDLYRHWPDTRAVSPMHCWARDLDNPLFRAREAVRGTRLSVKSRMQMQRLVTLRTATVKDLRSAAGRRFAHSRAGRLSVCPDEISVEKAPTAAITPHDAVAHPRRDKTEARPA